MNYGTTSVALHVSGLVSLPDHIRSVDPAPAYRYCAGHRLDAAHLVARCGAAGGQVFAATHAFIASPIGVLLLFLWSAAFFYHLCNGVRHLAWDAGYGFELRQAFFGSYAVLVATVVLTALAWLPLWLI